MKESDLIKRFKELLTLILEIETKIKYVQDHYNLDKELTALENEKEIIINQLKSCSDRTETIKKKENVRSVLTQLLNKFSRKDYPYNFSRDQGLIVYGFILIKIAEDIAYAFNYDYNSISEYYLELGSEFDIRDVTSILTESLDYLNNQPIQNYIELFDFVKKIQKKIVSIDKDCGRMKI